MKEQDHVLLGNTATGDAERPPSTSNVHPTQPIEKDEDGRLRFKGNAIVRWMLEAGRGGQRFDLNVLAALPFTDDDWQQLAQLLGYTLSGYEELSYVDDAAWDRVRAQLRHRDEAQDGATSNG